MTTSVISGVGDEVLAASVLISVSVIMSLYGLLQTSAAPRISDTERDSVTAYLNAARQPQVRARRAADDADCTICLARVSFACETNCRHIYCTECIMGYWRHRGELDLLVCPCCRDRVTLLVTRFSDEECRPEHERTCRQLQLQIEGYNDRFSGRPRSLLAQVRDLPMLLRHLCGSLMTVRGLFAALFTVRIAGPLLSVLAYVLSPFDLIPEALFGVIGLLDDLTVLLIGLIYVSSAYRLGLLRSSTHHQRSD